ncbi:R3H domain-containing nucleic acid-binding protein [Glutamicibacter sp. JC586]|uniref:Jag family protein n=1 Tax=Glutamicibacter sp. JC586 TaxID=2590552 RepID=UPI00135B79EF|nr:R3H domain-containing nucleic acid-binding protein [Glutamicibacter sp. JC586]
MTATENIDAPALETQIEDESEVLDEGEVAADYLEELLDIADLDGDIDIEIRGGRTYISILTEDADTSLNSLIADKGETLDALQELTRLAVLTATGERSRLILDIAGYRSDRADQLKKMAEEAIDTARSTGEKVHLDPMSAYERKLVHDVIADAGLHSESEGESTRRHIVISVLDS